MDPMAWLESLAARQGANPDELTTEANLEIAEPPADTVIDEPGYTRKYVVWKTSVALQAQAVMAAPEPQTEPEPELVEFAMHMEIDEPEDEQERVAVERPEQMNEPDHAKEEPIA